LNSFKKAWNSAVQRHAGAARGVKAIVHGLSLAGLITAGAYWTLDHESMNPSRPGDLLKVPGAVAMAPAQAIQKVVSPEAPSAPVAMRPGSLAAGIGQVLRRYTRDGNLADRIATAIVNEGNRKKINPILLVGVVLTENAKLQPAARSNVRATGLMQVMPFHSGQWGCGSADLVNVESNICHGTSILADLMKRKKSLRSALQGYNGCVRGTNTPHCHTYTGKVLGFANQTSRELSKIREKESLTRSAASLAE
jgi:hypothetical protein